MQKIVAETSSKQNALKNATSLHGDPQLTSKICVSSRRNHRFRECHRTFKIANLGPKTDLLSAFRRQKCRLGVEIVSKLVGDQRGDQMGDREGDLAGRIEGHFEGHFGGHFAEN